MRLLSLAAAFFVSVLPACLGTAPEGASVEDAFARAATEVHGDVRPDCLAEHLREAVAQNRARMPLYAEASNGESERVSKLLIGLEEASIVVAARVDEPSAVYHAAGIPIVCDGVVPMSWTPPFVAVSLRSVNDTFTPLNGEAVAADLRDALAKGGPDAVAALAHQWIGRLASTPHRHCLVRHVLESVARIALLAEDHERLARRRKLPSPAGIDDDLLRAHLSGLGVSAYLDEQAAPIQARGVPILCNDVPTIPMPGEGRTRANATAPSAHAR